MGRLGLAAVNLCLALAGGSAAEAAAFDRGAQVNAQGPAILQRHGAATLAVGVIRDGRLVFTGYWGEQSPGVPVGARSLFNVASLAKPVAAEALLRLAAKGELSLDDPLSAYWIDPDLKDDPRHARLTARIALSHRTGFANWRFREPDRKLRFKSEPGGGFMYSGEGYRYVVRFAERKTGRDFESIVAREVFRPIGMRSTAFSRKDWMAGRLVQPVDDRGRRQPPDLRAAGDPNPADDLFTTVEDYARFVISAMNRERLPPALAADRERIQVEVPSCPPGTPARACPSRAGMGLGWMRIEFGERVLIWHSGGDWSESSMAWFEPATRSGMVIFANGRNAQAALMDLLEAVEPGSPIVANYRAQNPKP